MGLTGHVRALAAKGVTVSVAYRALERAIGQRAGGFILAYHNLPAARFEEQVRALEPARPVPLAELLDRHTAGAPTTGLFAVTFDDGVLSTVRAIAAVARARQWPVTFYIPTGYVGNPLGMPFQWLRAIQTHLPRERVTAAGEEVDLRSPGASRALVKEITRRMYTRPRADYEPLIMALVDLVVARGLVDRASVTPPVAIGWEEMAVLARDACIAFESHGVSHVAVAALDPPNLERELRESRDLIREHTGMPCRHFCYPFGGPESIGADAPGVVARYYRSAVTMSRGRLRRHHPHLLPRVPVYPHDDAALVRLKILSA